MTPQEQTRLRITDETYMVTVTLDRLGDDGAEFTSLGGHQLLIPRDLWEQTGRPVCLDLPLLPWWPKHEPSDAGSES